MIDFRSDTVTKPTPDMLQAMMKAEVGDDVMGEDPTANLLQEKVAALLGKEGALFVPSGTMANHVSIRAWTEPGDEVILHKLSHTYLYESAAAAALCGVQLSLREGDRGILNPNDVAEAVHDAQRDHFPRSRVVMVENTHNIGGGSVYPVEVVKEISEVAKKKGLVLHMDGARLFNACVASGVEPQDYARHADSISICFSKGLGAPVGSAVAGSKEFIKRAHRFRKMFGGGMRQIGYLAAAAIYALDHNIERLAEDHENARLLAEAISRLECFRLDLDAVETNMVFFDVVAKDLDALRVVAMLRQEGVLMGTITNRRIRAVTHLDVSREDVLKAIEVFEKLFSERKT
ncbi:MAG: low-specificity L-threonine aldolase [bacterium]|nr:low-specificity L-threonine aldolase [bacterium]